MGDAVDLELASNVLVFVFSTRIERALRAIEMKHFAKNTIKISSCQEARQLYVCTLLVALQYRSR